MRVAALLLAACAAVSQAFVVPSSPAPASVAPRTRGVMSMLKVRALRKLLSDVDRRRLAIQSFGKG